MEYKFKYNEIIKKTYSIRLKKLRKDNKVLQKDLADLLGISRSLYGRYESEYEIMPTKHLNTLCNYFDVSFDYLFKLTPKKQYASANKDINLKVSGQRLRQFRKENNFSQADLADKLKVDDSMFTRYEKGDFVLPVHILYPICKEYKMSIDYILGKTDDPKCFK